MNELVKVGKLKLYVPRKRIGAHYIYREIFEDFVYDHPCCRVEPGDVVVDIGANIGMFSIYSLVLGASFVHAIEPSKMCFKCLEDNLFYYNALEKSSTYQKAAWSEKTILTLNDTAKEDLGKSWVDEVPFCPNDLAEKALEKGGCITDSYTVSADKVDSIVDGPVNFVKIDTEGAELEILFGMEQTIKSYKPKLAAAAYHSETHKIEFTDFILSVDPTYSWDIKGNTMFFF